MLDRTTIARARRLVLCGAVLCVAGVAYEVRLARAGGIPTTNPLTYSGTLMTFGAPDNATHSMTAALYVSGTQMCASQTAMVTCVNGQFTIPLAAGCLTIVENNPTVEIEVTIDGTTMGFTQLNAVPYAVVAANVSASGLTGVLPIASGGTNSTTQNFVDLSSAQTIGGNKTFTGAVAVDSVFNATGMAVQTTTLSAASPVNVTATAFTELNSSLEINFTVPPSGCVMAYAAGAFNQASDADTVFRFRLSSGATALAGGGYAAGVVNMTEPIGSNNAFCGLVPGSAQTLYFDGENGEGGETIRIRPGVYSESLRITLQPLM